MRSRGIETWRQHCDSYECAMYYYLLQKDYSEVTKEEYETVVNTQLPDGRELTRNIQVRLDGYEHYLSEQEKSKNKKDVKEDDKDMKW